MLQGHTQDAKAKLSTAQTQTILRHILSDLACFNCSRYQLPAIKPVTLKMLYQNRTWTVRVFVNTINNLSATYIKCKYNYQLLNRLISVPFQVNPYYEESYTDEPLITDTAGEFKFCPL
jgi:hypothetical protein